MAPQEARRRGAAPVAEEPRRAAEVAAVPPAPLVGPSPPREAPAALPTQLAPMDVLLPSRQAPAASESDRREAREAEELRRERAEAEARRREAERAAPPDKKESGAVVQALMLLRRRYKDSDPAGLLACLQTLKAYISNLAKSPLDPKFQRINCDNKGFQSRVAPFDGARAVLEACGFQPEGGALVVSETFTKSKGPKLWDALAKIDVLIDQLSRAT
ncbi:unnamed protein product [Prorocentrum cordatum]|uniref:PUB domain-containing protein n=1 Tax=Prorocentrum cordatum TaxID=2364126 RepID=A0ABN9UBL9_9DINO|nr:unnamed protein product [Polarella glacialis]